MSFASPLEKRLFALAAGCLLLIYASAFFVRPAVDLLREMNLLRVTMAAIFLVAGALIVAWRVRAGASFLEWAVIVLFAVAYLVILLRLRVPEERFHLIEYGLFGGLVYGAFRERRRARAARGAKTGFVPPAAAALLVTVAAGWTDEGLQGLLPNRWYDLRDVALNGLAGLLAIAFLGIVQALPSGGGRNGEASG